MYTNRISTAARYNLLTADIQKNEANYNRLTQQLASGKKITNITDDPVAAVNIVNTNRQLGQIDTFNQNAQMAMEELDTLDDLMELAGNYLNTAWDKAVQASNGTYGNTSLSAIKVEIDEITKTMVDLANTEYNDNYIFAGANTKLTPYEIDEDGNIIYRGTPHSNPDYIRQTEVADGVFEVINTTGDRVFGYYNSETDNAGVMGALKILSNSLQEIIDAREAEDPDAETAAYEKMHSTLDMFSKSHNEILTEQTKFGGVYNRMEMTESTLETNTENLTSYLSNLQDVDIASATSQWLQAQYAYQASLKVASSTMNMSLLNYL